VAEVTDVDKYGRVLIPKKIRDSLGLEPNSSLVLTIRGDELILKPVRPDLHRQLSELREFLSRELPSAFVTRPSEEDSKWMSKSYCLRKLGL